MSIHFENFKNIHALSAEKGVIFFSFLKSGFLELCSAVVLVRKESNVYIFF